MKKVKFYLEKSYFEDEIYFDNIDITMLSSYKMKKIFVERFFDLTHDDYEINCNMYDIDDNSKSNIDYWKILSKLLPYLYEKLTPRVDEHIYINYVFTMRGMIIYMKYMNKCIFDTKNIPIKNEKLYFEILRNKICVLELYEELFDATTNNKQNIK